MNAPCSIGKVVIGQGQARTLITLFEFWKALGHHLISRRDITASGIEPKGWQPTEVRSYSIPGAGTEPPHRWSACLYGFFAIQLGFLPCRDDFLIDHDVHNRHVRIEVFRHALTARC